MISSKNYTLDKTVFQAMTLREADNHFAYWKDKSLKERLDAACYLIINFTELLRKLLLTRLFLQNANTGMADIFNEHFKDFIRELNNNNVEYVLVGGMAVILHGYVRGTG